MSTAIVLFAHGARDPEWAKPMRCVQTVLRDQYPSIPIELAFLEFMAPDLSACVQTLTAHTVEQIVIVPMFIAQGGHLKRELPLIVETLRSTYPHIEFSLSGPVGEHPAVLAAMAEAAAEIAGLSVEHPND